LRPHAPVGWTCVAGGRADLHSATVDNLTAWLILSFRRLPTRPGIACCSSMIRP
jgi:hypothetical protein